MQDKVKLPAIGLIVLGVLGILAGLWSLFAGGVSVQQLVDMGVDPDQAEEVAKYVSSGGKILPLFGIAVAGFITWAGLQMKALKSWTAAVIANVLVMIPCFTSCCCVVGIPLGIWGLVVLMKPEVKSAFQGKSA